MGSGCGEDKSIYGFETPHIVPEMGSARLLELLAATRPGRRLWLPAAHRTGQAQDSGRKPAPIAGNGCRRDAPEAHHSFVGGERGRLVYRRGAFLLPSLILRLAFTCAWIYV